MRWWLGTTTVIFLLTLSVVLVLLLPPKSLVLAAGPENGAYARVALQYKEILARDNIAVQIKHTNGSVDNAGLLESGEVDVALLQGGIPVGKHTAEAIAGLFFEPMLFLVRAHSDVPRNPAHWNGLRITAGQQGSGTAAAFQDFLEAVELTPTDNTQLSLAYSDAVEALREGLVDMAVFVTTVDAPYLEQAFNAPDLAFLPLTYLDAISRRLDYTTIATVPTGAISLGRSIPPTPQKVLALETRLAMVPDLHPALINRLTMAAKELHASRDIITGRHAFPTVQGTGMEMNSVARELIQNGPSTWHGLLPYWMAAQVNRLLLLILPILFIVVPLLRVLPSLYAYFMGWRVWQHYPLIRQIEDELATHQDAEALAAMDRNLIEMDERIAQLGLPAAYRQAAYHARMHIDLVRKRIRDRQNLETNSKE
ncbi:TAXI family TRAP transporter solute-binding subunit [Shimia sp. Alg240-R146]|uniref:TAXI family TRAP transporter solute-binding subunit n=1 Tax=Shimia sp. Alg240-R146 TaxID=2993449 RepID=UPI0022DFC7E5|nr:TAXI family TRAP transporter solute-binding subunit [Shimia sp. Alg240-R146]